MLLLVFQRELSSLIANMLLLLLAISIPRIMLLECFFSLALSLSLSLIRFLSHFFLFLFNSFSLYAFSVYINNNRSRKHTGLNCFCCYTVWELQIHRISSHTLAVLCVLFRRAIGDLLSWPLLLFYVPLSLSWSFRLVLSSSHSLLWETFLYLSSLFFALAFLFLFFLCRHSIFLRLSNARFRSLSADLSIATQCSHLCT